MKFFVLPLSVLLNIATTCLIIVMILVLSRTGNLVRMAMLYAFIPVVVLAAARLIASVVINRSKEVKLTIAITRLVLEGLCYVSLGLGLRKLEDRETSLTWRNLVIPLWIITAAVGCAVLAIIFLLAIRLYRNLNRLKRFTNDVHVCLWGLANLAVFFYLDIHLLIVGPAFGDFKETFVAFLAPAIVGLVFSVLMSIWTAFCYSNL